MDGSGNRASKAVGYLDTIYPDVDIPERSSCRSSLRFCMVSPISEQLNNT